MQHSHPQHQPRDQNVPYILGPPERLQLEMMGAGNDEQSATIRAWQDAFVLPPFDVDRPYALQLDGESGRKKTQAWTVEGTVDSVAEADRSILDKGEGDEVLARFTQSGGREVGALGRLPRGVAGLLEAYNIVDGKETFRDPLSDCPCSWMSLDSEHRDEQYRLASGIGTTPQDIERVTSRKIDALTQWEGTLIKKLSLSDFEANETDDEELNSDTSHTDVLHAPWVPPSASIVLSMRAMGHGHASDNFAWSQDDMQFVLQPSTTILSPVLARLTARDGSAPQLIPGLSNVASQSLVYRFHVIGTLQRRLWWRVSDIRKGIKKDAWLDGDTDAPGELYALAGGMSSVLAWSVEETSRCSRTQGKGTLHSWAALDDLEVVLRSLAEMLRCDITRKPPFPPLLDSRPQPGSSSTKQSAYVISLVYTHLVAAVESCAKPRLVAMLRYLLDVVTSRWRKQLVNWIGWPCGEADRLPDEVEVKMFLGREARRDRRQVWRPKGAEVDQCEPWAGIEVEWGWDERGELDVGYVLRPVRLPAFLPIAHARDLLEAGRALRLLQRAAPEGHPLLTMRDRMREEARLWGTSRRALDVPRWRYDSKELATQNAAVHQCIRDSRREVAAWRRYKDRTARECARSRLEHNKAALVRDEHQHDTEAAATSFPWAAKGEGLEDALAVFDNAPDLLASTDEERKGIDTSLQSFLQADESGDAAAAHVPINTTTSLIAPMLQWSRLVNASLISVFFRDLHLGEYLDVCREFLLLGNQQFAARVAEVLLDDGSKTSKPGLVNGVGLSEVLRGDTSWPPGSSQLATTLNTAVLDSIANSRAQAALMKRVTSGSGTGNEKALLDLDDRLSFSIATTAKGHVEWQGRHTIRALDWLTISFQPPPLIAPLITLQVQLSYQRLFRFLLHLMRVDAVLKGVFRQLMARPQPSCPHWMDGLDLQRASRLRYEAHHFVSVLFRHATDVIIRQRWHIFRGRLNALRRSAESQDDAGQADEEATSSSTAAPQSESGVSEGYDAASDVDVAMYDGATDVGGAGGTADDESTPQQFALKDVFSIAAYHERTLDRMLSGCFLKTRQSVIMTILLDLFDMILAFGQLLQFVATDDDAEMGDDDGTEKSMSLSLLLARFQSKMRLLLQALDIVGQRAMDRGAASVLAGTPQRLRQSYDPPTAGSNKSTSSSSQHHRSSSGSRSRPANRSTASSARRHAAVDAEIARQEAETRRDLEELERNDRKGSMGDLEMIQALIAALQSRG